MGRRCDLTDRKTLHGGARRHRRGRSGANGVWNFKAPRTTRTWRPNLRPARVINPDGKIETLKISMKAYKKLRQGLSLKGYQLANWQQTSGAAVAAK